jgi:methylenetetrahydrofolate reductase (NADPH)
MERTLWEAIERLAPLLPSFVSVTYGAGGSTRERTHATVKRILTETDLVPAAHLTCVAATRAEIDAVARDYVAAGVRHIVALRGDPIGGVGERYKPHPGGYRNAADLVLGIRRIADIEVSVSAYPEKHPDSPTVEADIDMLKAKVEAGAARAITQFFFDNELYLRYLDRVRARAIHIPIVPGILPVQNFKQTKAFAERCGASVPAWLADRFAGLADDPATRKLIAAAVAAEQVLDLVDHGVTDFHFYTMNRADLVYAICHLLGLRPQARAVSRSCSLPLKSDGSDLDQSTIANSDKSALSAERVAERSEGG